MITIQTRMPTMQTSNPSPLGSTKKHQHIDSVGNFQQAGEKSSACYDSTLHNEPSQPPGKPHKSSVFRGNDCHITASHNGSTKPRRRRLTGLWLRGSVWQYRVAVPTDLRPKLARSDLNRSLGTSNYYDAVRMARKVAFQVECLFDQVRSGEQVQVDFGGGDHAEPEQASTITMDVDEVARRLCCIAKRTTLAHIDDRSTGV
ncbi:protein of unknown function [Magnetospirillum sp. XM-1]|uniref:DUF6538 domain-containing protein n=1 Tax=Magnetospirillum sp. XM-1 TaxID=1663591 RepID=UPI00073E04A9|nr:DUF6538 domain-containing protein [Magnetospirillum sp. XM-1]CUW37261.1 protein of unknown function [Magnetospirillum sp. XM-1]